MTLQSGLDLIEHSVSIEPNQRTKNSPSPPMTSKSSQAMIANGLAGLSSPLSLTHFFNTELPPTHPLSALVLAWAICWHQAQRKTTTPQPHPPPPNFVFQLPCLPVMPTHKVLTIINNLLSLIITMYLLHCFGWSWYRHQYNMEAKMGKTQLSHLQ